MLAAGPRRTLAHWWWSWLLEQMVVELGSQIWCWPDVGRGQFLTQLAIGLAISQSWCWPGGD